MSEVCGVTLNITGTNPLSDAERTALANQAETLEQMALLLELRDEIMAFIQQYTPRFNRGIVAATGTRTRTPQTPTDQEVEAAMARAREAQLLEVDETAAQEAVSIIHPGQTVDDFLANIGRIVNSLQEYTEQAFFGHGIGPALQTLLNNRIPALATNIRGRMADNVTVHRIILGCYPNFDEAGVMALEPARLREIAQVLRGLRPPRATNGGDFSHSEEGRTTFRRFRESEDARWRRFDAGDDQTMSRMDRWARRWALWPFLAVSIGGHYSEATEDQPQTTALLGEERSGVDIDAAGGLRWAPRANGYRFGLGLEGELGYTGVFGGSSDRSEVVDWLGLVTFNGYHERQQAWRPYWALGIGAEGRWSENTLLNTANPNGWQIDLSGQVGLPFIWEQFALEAGLDFAHGEYNTLAWQRLLVNAGVALNFEPVSLSIAYQHRIEGRGDGEGEMDYTDGSGFTFALNGVARDYYQFGLSLQLSAQEGYNTLYGASGYFEAVRLGGHAAVDLRATLEYGRTDLNLTADGDSYHLLFRLAFNNIQISRPRQGGYGVYMGVEAYVGRDWFFFQNEAAERIYDTSGIIAGGQATIYFGPGRMSEYRQQYLGPTWGTPLMRRLHSEVVPGPLAGIEGRYSDTLYEASEASLPGVNDTFEVLRLLVAYRRNLLDENYQIATDNLGNPRVPENPDDVLAMVLASRDYAPGQRGRYGANCPGEEGYCPPLGTTVELGDVAPLATRIGTGGSVVADGSTPQRRSRYSRGIDDLEPREQLAVRAIMARRRLRAQGVELDGPNQGTELVGHFISIIERFSFTRPNTVTWEAIDEVYAGTMATNLAEFRALVRESLEARAVTEELLALGRFILLRVIPNTGENQVIRQAIIRASAFELNAILIQANRVMTTEMTVTESVTPRHVVQWLRDRNLIPPEVAETALLRFSEEVFDEEEIPEALPPAAEPTDGADAQVEEAPD